MNEYVKCIGWHFDIDIEHNSRRRKRFRAHAFAFNIILMGDVFADRFPQLKCLETRLYDDKMRNKTFQLSHSTYSIRLLNEFQNRLTVRKRSVALNSVTDSSRNVLSPLHRCMCRRARVCVCTLSSLHTHSYVLQMEKSTWEPHSDYLLSSFVNFFFFASVSLCLPPQITGKETKRNGNSRTKNNNK